MMGYHPRLSTLILDKEPDPTMRPFIPSLKAEEFVADLERYWQYARDAIVVLAQERQAKEYNKGRRPVDDIQPGDQVLINPHTLKLVDAEGTGKTLIQQALGPFEVLEQVTSGKSQIHH